MKKLGSSHNDDNHWDKYIEDYEILSDKRKRKNFRIPIGLSEWVEKYAENKRTTVTQLIIDFFIRLKRGERG